MMDPEPADPRADLVAEVLLLVRIAYAEGFRDGVQWWPDAYVGVSQAKAFDYARDARDTVEDMVRMALAPKPDDGVG